MSRFVEMWRAEQLKAQIQQRDALMAQLEMDKNQAEESNRLKTRFMATVSHEGLCLFCLFRWCTSGDGVVHACMCQSRLTYVLVRTPLNAIIGMLDMTLNTELDNKQREYLTSVQFAADSLLRIVNDVLDIRYSTRTQTRGIL
jgi:signal transduction histidine kinase